MSEQDASRRRRCECCGRRLPEEWFVAGYSTRPAWGVLYSAWCLGCRGMVVPFEVAERLAVAEAELVSSPE